MLARIQIRRDSEENWNTNSSTYLYEGEVGYETDTGRFKIGGLIPDPDNSGQERLGKWEELPYQLGQWTGDNVTGDITFGYQSGEGNVRIQNNLQVEGNLYVKGTTTTVNSKEVTFNDRMLTLNWSEDPIKSYESGLISGVEVNIGYNSAQNSISYQSGGGLAIDIVGAYVSGDNETVITLSQTLSNWPTNYNQNYVIYFDDFTTNTVDPDLAFFIKSYNGDKELTLIGDASKVSVGMDFEIHDVIRQLYWDNSLDSWKVDDDFRATKGVILGDNSGDEVGTIKFDGTDFKGRFANEWKSISSSTHIGTSAPSNPLNSDLWWDSEDGTLKIWYDDNSSQQWVTIGSGGGSGGSSGGGNYGNDQVDTHLNRNGVSAGQVLSWDGTDYAWINQSSGGAGIALSDLSVGSPNSASGTGSISYNDTTGVFTYTPPNLSGFVLSSNLNYYTNTDVDAHLNKNSAANNQILSWDGSNYTWINQPSGGAGISLNDVDAHLNKNSAANNQILSWNGTDYEWVAKGSTLSNISDATFGVDVTGKVQADGIELGSDGLTASAGSTLDFSGTTIDFQSTTIQNDTVFNGIINNHIWSGNTKPTDGYVLSWNSSLHSGDGDYEWVAKGSTLSNISDATFGVDVTGKVQADGIELGSDGLTASAGSSLIFEGTTINFGSATITGGNAFNSVINNHIWSGNTKPTDGYVLSWNSSLHSGDGDYEWVAQSSGGQSESSITWTLTANESSDYVFSGPGIETGNTNDPELFLVRGQTYKFDNQSGGHPFEIRTSSGGSPYTSGVSESGTVTTFTVPMDAPDTLYYQCTSHPSMLGTINIISTNSGGGTSLWTESGNNVYYDSGDVGIGTSTPSAKLQIDIPEYDSNTHNSDPVSSLVVGYGSQSLGHSCISIGRNTTSGKDDGDGTFSGHHSVAMGAETTASGESSTAIGVYTTASGNFSTAMGQETEATGQSSTAMGYKTKAIGINSTAMGQETIASGKNSTAMGQESEASGQWSTAIGGLAIASNQYCTSIGSWTTASGLRSTAMGHNIQVNGMYSFGIGLNLPDEVNGVQYHTISQDNTMAIMGGNVGIGTVAPSENLEVDGAIKLGTTTNDTAGTIKWTGTDFEGNVNGTWKSLTTGGAGGSLQSRTTIDTSAMQITSGSSTIAANSSASGYITGYKAYSLFKVSINDPDLWVTIYTDNTSMTNDSTRLYTEDPPPGSGVIAEFISNTSNQDIIVSPTTIGFNMDSTVSNNIYLKVQNIGSSDSTFSIELTILQLEQ